MTNTDATRTEGQIEAEAVTAVTELAMVADTEEAFDSLLFFISIANVSETFRERLVAVAKAAEYVR